MPETVTLEFGIHGLMCGACVARVEKKITRAAGVISASVNLTTENARVVVDDATRASGVFEAVDAAGYQPQAAALRLEVGGMHCGGCVARVEKTLARTPGIRRATVNLATGRADIAYIPGAIDTAEIVSRIEAAGYTAASPERAPVNEPASAHDEATALKREVLIATPFTVGVFVIAMGQMLPGIGAMLAAIASSATWLTIQLLLVLPVQFWAGRRFYRTGFAELAHGAPGMNSLVLIGSNAAFLYSFAVWLVPGLFPPGTAHAYFDAAAMIVTLILMGRWLEAVAKGRTSQAVRGLLALQARTARVWRGEAWQETAIEAVAVDDRVLIRPGERVPVDARVTAGRSMLDESMISGEPMAVTKREADTLIAGTVNQNGTLEATVTHVGDDTTLARIIRLVEDAQAEKPAIQAIADRIAGVFVPVVMGIAAATFIGWWLLGPAPVLSHAFVAAVAVLLIACPCAMGLATPTAIMVGTGRAARLGVLFRRGTAIEVLAQVDTVVFDKTGTLTQGRPAVTDIQCAAGRDEDDMLARIAALETRSEHPLGAAIVAAGEDRGLRFAAVDDVEIETGRGIRGQVAGASVAIGSAAYMTHLGIDIGAWPAEADRLAAQARTPLYVAIDGQFAGLVAVADPVRAEARDVVTALQAAGLYVAMLTGDQRATAQAIAHELGITRVIADVRPADKANEIAALQQNAHRVAFVGDGVNDAPALARADVGIAIGTGTDIAIEAGDIVLMRAALDGVLNARRMARATMRTIRGNFVWAYGYNAALIPLAAGLFYPWTGWLLNPAIAAGAMSLSSVFVLAHSLRLRRIKTITVRRETC